MLPGSMRPRVGGPMRTPLPPRRGPMRTPGPVGNEEEEREVDAALVDETMAMLLTHDRASVPLKRRVGERVLDAFFGGEDPLVRSWRPRRGLSFRELVKRARGVTTWSEMALRRAVWAEIVARGLPRVMANEIGWDLLWRLYSVRNVKVREGLARRIAAGEIEGGPAQEEIARAAEREREGSRPRRPAWNLIRRAQRIFQKAIADGAFNVAGLRALGGKRDDAIDALEEIVATAKETIVKLKSVR